ncbi:MAG: histidinol phosphatase [Ferruginibacter sp.]|nr:hypothetical protein [Bacteroidota bacterium]MBX2917912.1 histidinol phosphatase [Ferruginibacter sp.]MCB0709862.1 histidinol phosphatase [Chitinophagaceae bacterium]
MFNFFKNNIKEESLALPFTTDIHSHILPGIDDGAADLETSLLLIKGLYSMGIRKAIATPHIIGDLYQNTPFIINNALATVKDAVKKAGIKMELHAAAEYMLDDYFIELLRSKSALLTLHKNIILTEISYSTAPDNLEQILAEIFSEGYLPILAHPERYHYYHNNYKKYQQLKEMGFMLQVNILSLTGYYGKSVKKAAKYILENNLANLLGTDLHHHNHLAALTNFTNRKTINKYMGPKIYNNLNSIITT